MQGAARALRGCTRRRRSPCRAVPTKFLPSQQRLRIVAKDQTGIKDLLIKDMIEDWWKKNEQERMNSKMTSAAESSMSSAD